MQELKNSFDNDQELDKYLNLKFKYDISKLDSQYSLDRNLANEKLAEFTPIFYAKERNFLDANLSNLSHYIRHGIISSKEISDYMLSKYKRKNIEKFLQEIYWRHFWQVYYLNNPSKIWNNIEHYKTGFKEEDYHLELPKDIKFANTPNQIINIFINELINNGYLHNHARMYLASYIIHFRRIKWQIGAKWFLEHLIDADIATNNLSFQWIASTFSNKAYIFNLENIIKYCTCKYDIDKSQNPELNFTYQELTKRLFPKS